MKTYTVKLESGTIGKLTSFFIEWEEGDEVEINFHDENGNKKSETGVIDEILETDGDLE